MNPAVEVQCSLQQIVAKFQKVSSDNQGHRKSEEHKQIHLLLLCQGVFCPTRSLECIEARPTLCGTTGH